MSAEQFRVAIVVLAIAFLAIFYNHDRYAAIDPLWTLDKRTGSIYSCETRYFNGIPRMDQTEINHVKKLRIQGLKESE